MTQTPSTLTPREIEVAHLLTQGKSNQAIAFDLHITPTTVTNHVKCLSHKLGAKNRVHAASIFTQRQIQEPHLLTTDPPLWLTLIHQETTRLKTTETTTSCAHAALDMASLIADVLAGLTHRIEALEREQPQP